MKHARCRAATARLSLAFLVAGSLIAGAVRGQVLTLVGVGTIGQWDTEFEMANPYSGQITCQVGSTDCSGSCGSMMLSIPPFGSIKLRQAELFSTNGLYVMSIIAAPSTPADELPTVRARVLNTAVPSQAVEVPVLRSFCGSNDTGILAFPSVKRTPTGHSNLVLANLAVDQPTDLTVNIDLYDPSGSRLAGTRATIAMEQPAGHLLFLTDIVGRLGVTSLDDGQIVVTHPGSPGIPWGFVSTVDSIAGVTISVGRNE